MTIRQGKSTSEGLVHNVLSSGQRQRRVVATGILAPKAQNIYHLTLH